MSRMNQGRGFLPGLTPEANEVSAVEMVEKYKNRKNINLETFTNSFLGVTDFAAVVRRTGNFRILFGIWRDTAVDSPLVQELFSRVKAGRF